MTRYVKVVNDKAIHYSIEELLEEYPDAKIYNRSSSPNEGLLKKYNVYPLITTPKPEGNFFVEEGEPIFNGFEWVQSWNVRNYTEENVDNTIQEKPENIQNYPDPQDFNPFNFFSPFLESNDIFVDEETKKLRYDICKSCDRFMNLTKQCKECGCFMTLKTKLKGSSCPLSKW